MVQILQSMKLTLSSIFAGIAISIGCIAFLMSGNPWTFPIGLLLVCFFGFHLYTGKVSYGKVDDIPNLVYMLSVNIAAATVMGLIVHHMQPELVEKAIEISNAKLSAGLLVIPKAILCNILIFAAVHMWKNLPSPNNLLGMYFTTAIFVICGFEHCVANAFYFACAQPTSIPAWFLTLNILGNTIGGVVAYQITKYLSKG